MKKIIVMLMFAGASFAQEAKIMIVERPDSQRLSGAYRDYKDALRRWQEVKADVAKHYTQESGKTLPGWENIQFSADFRALVPKSSQYAYNGYCYGYGTTLTTTNATGTMSTAGAALLNGVSDLDVITDLKTKEK